MKKILVAAAAFSIGLAVADDDVDSWCSQIGEMSRAVMDLRQSGFALDEVLKITKKSSGDNEQLKRMSRNIARLAYHEPIHQRDESKRAAIVEFQNKQQLNCLRAND